jgi:hypothetical protein
MCPVGKFECAGCSLCVERYLEVLQSQRFQRPLGPGRRLYPNSEAATIDPRWIRLRFATARQVRLRKAFLPSSPVPETLVDKTARQGCNLQRPSVLEGGRVTEELSPDFPLILDVQPQPAVAVEQVPWGVQRDRYGARLLRRRNHINLYFLARSIDLDRHFLVNC